MNRLTIDGLYCDIVRCGARCGGMCDNRRVYERLREIEVAEAQGQLVRLPCRVGTKIFEANRHFGKVFQRLASKEDMLTKIVPGWGSRYFPASEDAYAALTPAPAPPVPEGWDAEMD